MNQLNMKYTIIMDTDSQEVIDWSIDASRSKGVVNSRGTISYLTRNPRFCSNDFGGNFILRNAVSSLFHETYAVHNPKDVIWQCFVTTPYLSVDTVRSIVSVMDDIANRHILQAGRNLYHDSLLTVTSQQGFFWTSGLHPTPIGGYRPEIMLPTQEMPPLYKEIHGMFGITAEAFERYGCRTGDVPFFYNVPKSEAVDIDWEEDAKNVFEKEDSADSSSNMWSNLLANLSPQLISDLNKIADRYSRSVRAVPQPQTGDQNDPR